MQASSLRKDGREACFLRQARGGRQPLEDEMTQDKKQQTARSNTRQEATPIEMEESRDF
jgi:hypothetical protein